MGGGRGQTVPAAPLGAATPPPGATGAASEPAVAAATTADPPPDFTVPSTPAQPGAAAGTGLGIPPAPSRPRRRRRWLLAVAVLALLVAGGLAAAALALRPRWLWSEPLLPFEAQRLPTSATMLVRTTRAGYLQSQVGYDAESMPEEAVWSSLALGACSGGPGSDLYAALIDLGATVLGIDSGKIDDLKLSLAARALGPRLVATKLALRCGRDLARRSNITGLTATRGVVFRIEKKIATVVVDPILGDARPEADPPLEKRSFRDFRGFCQPKLSADGNVTGKCDDSSYAAATVGDLRISGELRDVDEFTRLYEKAAEEPTGLAEAVVELGSSLAPFSHVVVTTSMDSFEPLLDSLSYVARDLGAGWVLRELMPSDREKKAGDAIGPRIRGRAVGLERATTHGGFRCRMAFVSKAPDAAAAVATELDDLRKEWRAHLTNNDADIRKKHAEAVKDLPEAERDYQDAMLEALLRAVHKARVQRSGQVVSLDLIGEPQEGEQRRIRHRLLALKERSTVAARLIRALAGGRDPDPPDLEFLGGKQLLELMARAESSSAPESAPGGSPTSTARARTCSPGDPLCSDH
jgi:hypothetical protein